MRLINLSFFFLLIGGAQAFVFSCNEINKLINENLQEHTKYVCLIPQEGYSNTDPLKTIYAQSDKVSTSFADLLGKCVERPSTGPWQVIADLPVMIDCTLELSLIFTSDPPSIVTVPSQPSTISLGGDKILVLPQTRMQMHKQKCSGSGNVTIYTGAGSGVAEYRFPMVSWRCADMPDWIVSFENVITVSVDSTVQLTVELSALEYNSDIIVAPSDRVAVMASGRSDDRQLLDAVKNVVNFKNSANVSVDVKSSSSSDLSKDILYLWTNNVQNIDAWIPTGDFSWSGFGSVYGLEYLASNVAPQNLWDKQDTFVCQLTLGAAPAAPTASAPVDGVDPYCQCGRDTFGLPDGHWDPTEIWMDIAIIIDTSEAMGPAELEDATSLIESFFGTSRDDVLTTNTNAKFYTRVGVIAMSDKAEVLYNMNMTKADSLTDKIKTKNGLQQIDVLAAFFAAQTMLQQIMPQRDNTRQVIYYLTDSAPNFDHSGPNSFKNSYGKIIVNNFIAPGVVERTSLKDLASPGYYSTQLQEDYMDSIQLFCKANCYCRPDNERSPYAGLSTDPAVKASGGCYHLSSGKQYDNVKTKQCNIGNGLIASVHDPDKAAFLNQLVHAALPDQKYFWLGYTRNDDGSTWTWEDKSTNPYTHWDTDRGEPSPASVSSCAYIDMTNSSLYWYAGNCNMGLPGVCEYKPCSVGNDNC